MRIIPAILFMFVPASLWAQMPELASQPPPVADSISGQAETPPDDTGENTPSLLTPTVDGGDAILGAPTVNPAPAVNPALPVNPPSIPPKSVFSAIPPVFTFSRLGEFSIPPEGPGTYSFVDALRGYRSEKPPVFPYGRISLKPFPFYDVDYRYLDKPGNRQTDWSDVLKRRRIGNAWLFTTGGELRIRQMNEADSRLKGVNNSYDLLRTTVYGSLWYEDRLGFFVQGIDAQSYSQNLKPLGIDVNHSDLLDAFVDVKVGEVKDKPIYVRGGRQELNLGSQRLISNLEWANTLRTFQGVRTFWQSEKLDLNVFWLQPVIVNPTHFDSPDQRQNFSGGWLTYRPEKGHFLDLYALNLDQTRPVASGEGGKKGGFNVTTIGSRYAGNRGNILWDVEGDLQFGSYSNQNLFAGAASSGVGYKFSELRWDPQWWFNYDFASGDAHPGKGNSFGTFNQLFPFGHYYLGYLDLVGRQNIHDFHTQFVMYPTKWIFLLLQAHHFVLDSSRSPLFNAGGVAIRQDLTGKAGTNVGNELDFLANFHVDAHQDVLLGYSKLFAGSFIQKTGNPSSPELFYLQYQYRW